MAEFCDGTYRCPLMGGLYHTEIPMLVLQWGINKTEILFYNRSGDYYDFRYVYNDTLTLADGPGEFKC